ncbi:MAG: hypothetical protein AVDCRST_MAG85-2169, partial [uncultured Solirubrobacteraceae bacterium]
MRTEAVAAVNEVNLCPMVGKQQRCICCGVSTTHHDDRLAGELLG